jgi:hypothetical protein
LLTDNLILSRQNYLSIDYFLRDHIFCYKHFDKHLCRYKRELQNTLRTYLENYKLNPKNLIYIKGLFFIKMVFDIKYLILLPYT